MVPRSRAPLCAVFRQPAGPRCGGDRPFGARRIASERLLNLQPPLPLPRPNWLRSRATFSNAFPPRFLHTLRVSAVNGPHARRAQASQFTTYTDPIILNLLLWKFPGGVVFRITHRKQFGPTDLPLGRRSAGCGAGGTSRTFRHGSHRRAWRTHSAHRSRFRRPPRHGHGRHPGRWKDHL